MSGPADVQGPKALHPAFYGCYDWHSSVHGHWMLARGWLRLFPGPPGSQAEIRGRAQRAFHLTEANLKGRGRSTSQRQGRPARSSVLTGGRGSSSWPRSWAGWDDPDAKRWGANISSPLVDVIVANATSTSSPSRPIAIRTGVHPNTAFGLAFAHDYARSGGQLEAPRSSSRSKARALFRAGTSRSRRAWEPGGADFFSPSLMEADLMRRVLPPGRVPVVVRPRSCPVRRQGGTEGAVRPGHGDRSDSTPSSSTSTA